MSLSLLLLICSLIVTLCNSTKCLAFSGGGIRAAMGAYYTMLRIEEDGTLRQIQCISLISGGSWGFVLWLYEVHPDSARAQILQSMYEHDGTWGTIGPGEFGVKTKSWYDRWSSEIKKNILDMTLLKDERDRTFSTFRARLAHKGLGGATVYFVVESVDSRIIKTGIEGGKISMAGKEIEWKDRSIKRTDKTKRIMTKFIDYCWFKSSAGDGEQFECTKDSHPPRPIIAVELLDILNYCSSGWATAEGHASEHRHTTKEFLIRPYGGRGEDESFRLIDAGGTFNDPLVPYMIDERYKHSAPDHVVIWNFDFSYFKKSEPLGNLFDFMRIRPAMKRIGKPIESFLFIGRDASGTVDKGKQFEGKAMKSKYKFEIDERIIEHYPLYGEHSKETMIQYFPTMVVPYAKRWNMMEFISFEKEWTDHLKAMIRVPPPPPVVPVVPPPPPHAAQVQYKTILSSHAGAIHKKHHSPRKLLYQLTEHKKNDYDYI